MTTNNIDVDIAEEGDPIYENKNYEVNILYMGDESDPYVDGKYVYRTAYAIINKVTGVIEHVCVQLPEAIFTAVGLDAALEKAPWKWAEADTTKAPVVN